MRKHIKRLLEATLLTVLFALTVMSLYWILNFLVCVFTILMYMIPLFAVVFIIWATIECIKESLRG